MGGNERYIWHSSALGLLDMSTTLTSPLRRRGRWSVDRPNIEGNQT